MAPGPQKGEIRFTGPMPEMYDGEDWRPLSDEGVTAPVDDVQTVFFKGHDDDPDG